MPPPAPQSPLVCIGIPTYNRVDGLKRAIDSVLGQTHRELRLVISDNASSDATEALCREFARRDDRIRYVRHNVNRGPTANFNFLFEELRDDYTMLLADDDWLDRDYVATCLAELRRRPDHALVCGRARYFRGDRPAGDGVRMQLPHDDPGARVAAYYAAVDDNGTFYGVMPREVLRRVAPMPNVLGNDWFHVAAIAFCGKVHTLETTRINRELGGTSQTIDEILAVFGARSRVDARLPYVKIAAGAFAQIAWASPVYAPLGPARRLGLGLRAASRAFRWKFSAWHLVAPTMLRLRRRQRGRWLWHPFEWLVRRGGGFVEDPPGP